MIHARAGRGWPALRVDDWEPTRRSLHTWTQIVGKVRLAHAPLLNHYGAAADLMNWDRNALESDPNRRTHENSSR